MLPLALTKKTQTAASFVDLLVQAINASGGLVIVDDDADPDAPADALPVSAADLELALPKTKDAPYNNDWIAADDLVLATVAFADNDIVAFKHADDAAFNIVQSEYVD